MKTMICMAFFLAVMPRICAQEFSAMTYNIRFDNPGDGENRWDTRKFHLAGMLRSYRPDILGIQEGLYHQVSFMDSALQVYNFLGGGRDDGKGTGEFCGIFYKSGEFMLMDSGLFWLSETPDTPSIGWDAAFKRICVYGLLKQRKSGHRLLVLNTHLDHRGIQARQKSISLILSSIQEINVQNDPVVILGDFNLEPGSAELTPLLADYADAKTEYSGILPGPEGTFNDFRFDLPVLQRIDYIFITKERFEVRQYSVIRDSFEGKYPSDHLPVFVHLKFK